MITSLAACTLIVATTLSQAEAAPPPSQQSIVAELTLVLEAHSVPGMAAAVFTDETMLAVDVAGVRNLQAGAGNPIALNDRFHLGSMTKAYVATMIAALVDAGTLRWDSTLSELFPEHTATMKEPWKTVKLENLLTHTAAVAPYTFLGEYERGMLASLEGSPVEQRSQFIQKISSDWPLPGPRNTRFMTYSNAGYGFAAAMAEKKTGQTWEELVQIHVFKPLGLRTSGFGYPATEADFNQPWGHMRGERRTSSLDPRMLQAIPPVLAPAGDINANVTEVATFVQAHMAGLKGKSNALKAETYKKLHTPDLNNYAMGWVVIPMFDSTAHWHNGSAGSFFTWMTFWPEHNIGIVVLTNSSGSEPACRELTERLFNRFVTPKPQASAPAPTPTPAPLPMPEPALTP